MAPPMAPMPPPGAYGGLIPSTLYPGQINQIPNPFTMVPGAIPYGALPPGMPGMPPHPGLPVPKKPLRPSSANPKQSLKKSQSEPFMAPIIPVGASKGPSGNFPKMPEQDELMRGALWLPDFQVGMDPAKMTEQQKKQMQEYHEKYKDFYQKMQDYHNSFLTYSQKHSDVDRELEEEMHKSFKQQMKEPKQPVVVENIDKVVSGSSDDSDQGHIDEEEDQEEEATSSSQSSKEDKQVKIVKKSDEQKMKEAMSYIYDQKEDTKKQGNNKEGIDPDVGAFQIEMSHHDSFNLDMDKNEEEAYAEQFKEYGLVNGNGGGGSSLDNNAKYSKFQNGGVKTVEEQMNEMYENMYGIPMGDDDMEMDMEPMNEEEFRATLNGHNGSNLDIIHEKPDDEVDASGSRGEASKSGSGKHESPQDVTKGQKGDTKVKKPPKKPNQNGNSDQNGASNGSKNGASDKPKKQPENVKRPDSANKKNQNSGSKKKVTMVISSPTRDSGTESSLKLSGKRESSQKRKVVEVQ